jgi:predicted GH43/DUF377 family glycosyl hydrolase
VGLPTQAMGPQHGVVKVERLPGNPVLKPIPSHEWEGWATFNGCVLREGSLYRMLYRAMAPPREYEGHFLSLSTIGYAESNDGVHFHGRRQLIRPEHEWERFGCEDPRVTRLDGKYYIFYTALSHYPFRPEGIRVGLAITRDFVTIEEKRLVTPFNAKAMALFPERIGGRLVGVLTANTDLPPAKIALAFFEREADLWDQERWRQWYASLDEHTLPLMRSPWDQVEVGAPPVAVEGGWLLVYAYIKDYRREGGRVFGVEAVLLDRDDPFRIRGRTREPILVPGAYYERIGHVMNVVFPSGAVVVDDHLLLYYGAADTTVAVARVSLPALLAAMRPHPFVIPHRPAGERPRLHRYEGNPILTPRPEVGWEGKSVFNPGVLAAKGRVHMLYRALSEDNTSVLGYASSPDGVHFDERPTRPAYEPREGFERKAAPGLSAGCEDPRLTLLEGAVHLLYTAFDGYTARVAYSRISLEDFLARRWTWSRPVVLSAPGVWDKNAALLPARIKGKFYVFHRLSVGIWVDWLDAIEEAQERWLGGKVILTPRPGMWDNAKVGIAAPPIATEHGWLMLYHGVQDPGTVYRVGVALLAEDDPTRVLARSAEPILEPEMEWERQGLVPNVVFPCGAVLLGEDLHVYYGGADRVIGVAAVKMRDLLDWLLRHGRQGT